MIDHLDKVNKEMPDLNCILDHTDLTSINRSFHPTAAEHTVLRNTWTHHMVD